MTIAGSVRTVVVWAVCVVSAATGLLAQRYTFRQYGSADGLGNLSLNTLLQDRAGYIWAGTDNGLFRYDGNRFTAFGHAEGLPNSEILSTAESPDGVLWAATQGGIARLVGNRFKVMEGSVEEPFLSVAFDHSGNIYLLRGSGILRGDPDGAGGYKFQEIAHGSIGAMTVGSDSLWFARGGDLWRLKAGKVERFGSPADLPSANWNAVAEDKAGNLWVRSTTLLYELPRRQGHFVNRSAGVANSSRSRLYADAHGRMLVSTVSGIVIFDGANRTSIDARSGLPADSVAPILLDREESLWLGMFGGGVVRRLGHGEWLSWKKEDGLTHNSIWSVLHSRAGELWVGSSFGLTVFDPAGKVTHTWNSHNGLAGGWIRSIIESPDGDVLVGTFPGGISRFTQQGKLLKTFSDKRIDQVIAMAIDREGKLWVAGPAAGVFRSENPVNSASELKLELIQIPGIPGGSLFRDIHIASSGVVWITSSHGLARFDGTGWRVFSEADGLKSNDLSALAEGADDLWVGYRDALGMARLEFSGGHATVTSYTKQDGLASDLIYALAVDKAGRLWASTDNGIDLLEDGHWRHYGREDGLIWDDGNDLALSTDDGGNVWIGTSDGLSRLAKLPYPITSDAPPVVLTSIEGGSQEFQAGDRPALSHTQDSLVIRFSSLNYASETSTRFRYRLEGAKGSWKETRERSVHFDDLPAGRYVFEVVAAGPDGMWSPVPARFAFSIKPPWWATWWFVAGCLLTGAFLAVALWKFRVRTLVMQQELLKQRVADQTAELIKSHRQLEELAYCDMLTSLPNRRMFAEKFRARLALARRQSAPFALLLVDLDHFKSINDTYGHDAGDAVLFETAARLRVAVRESDCVARLGGDEFAILLVTVNQTEGIEGICRRIINNLGEPIEFNDVNLNIGCSLGVAMFPDHGDTQENLYKSADLALYEAKRASRNNFRWYDPELGRRTLPEQQAVSVSSETGLMM
jgi:diguanylate cyclase (GGDEF)-like protein